METTDEKTTYSECSQNDGQWQNPNDGEHLTPVLQSIQVVVVRSVGAVNEARVGGLYWSLPTRSRSASKVTESGTNN